MFLYLIVKVYWMMLTKGKECTWYKELLQIITPIDTILLNPLVALPENIFSLGTKAMNV